jgi:hypothetical protein
MSVKAETAVIESPYEAHQKVYPREVSGRFARLRVCAVIALARALLCHALGALERAPGGAVRPAGEKILPIFGLTLFPQDFYLLTWLLIIAALSLFFFTALAGRLWCGFACPQTVWTQIFVWMERFTEGNRSQQIKLDKAPWTANKILRKTSKQVLWIGSRHSPGSLSSAFFRRSRAGRGSRRVAFEFLGAVLGGILRRRDVRQRRLPA